METLKPKLGRPLSAAGPNPIRSIRVPDADWNRWRAEATRNGKTLSQWIRDQIHVPNDTVSHNG